METSAEVCWRLAKACGQWAVESRDSAARIAFPANGEGMGTSCVHRGVHISGR